jgi:hypothetical protein
MNTLAPPPSCCENENIKTQKNQVILYGMFQLFKKIIKSDDDSKVNFEVAL